MAYHKRGTFKQSIKKMKQNYLHLTKVKCIICFQCWTNVYDRINKKSKCNILCKRKCIQLLIVSVKTNFLMAPISENFSLLKKQTIKNVRKEKCKTWLNKCNNRHRIVQIIWKIIIQINFNCRVFKSIG